jgi:molybdopterin-guanine dinucleotide biosynthesis protein A
MKELKRTNLAAAQDVARYCIEPDPQLSAVLLAGGRSRRMGSDKALLSAGNQPIVQLLAARLQPLTNQVFLSANEPELYRFLNMVAVPDVFTNNGPLAGLHAAMIQTERPWLLALACDLPCVTTDLLRRLLSVREDYHLVVPETSDGLLHPTCALYHRQCLPIIERNLRAGKNQLIGLLDEPGLHVRRWAADAGTFADTDLLDINTPQDYIQFQLLFKS